MFDYTNIGELIRKISGLNGDVILSEALTVDTKNVEKLNHVMEEEENEATEDVEEIKTIAGKEVNAKLESDDLILHLVSTSLNDIHEKYVEKKRKEKKKNGITVI